MDFRQLRTFVLIGEAGSLSEASERLHTVQPALSRQMRLLEESVGAQLFVRHARGMSLTDAGECLLLRARRAMRELEEARADITALAGKITGRVGLGMLPSVADLLVARFTTAMRGRYEHVKLRIATGVPAHLLQWLEAQEIDVAIVYQPVRPANLTFQPLIEEPLFLVGLKSSDLGGRSCVPLNALGGYPLILSPPDDELRATVERAAHAIGVDLNIVMEANFMHNVQKTLIQAGFGFTVLPSSALQNIAAEGDMAFAQIVDPPLYRRVGIGVPMMRKRPLVAQCVTELLIEQILEIFSSGVWRGARFAAGSKFAALHAERRAQSSAAQTPIGR